MPTVQYINPGADALFTANAVNGLWSLTNPPTPTSSTNFVHGGHPRSAQVTSGVSDNSGLVAQSYFTDAGSRISCYLLIDTIPNGDLKMNPIEIDQSNGTTCFGITIRTTGKLAIYDKNNVIQATGNTVLSINTWYRISVTYTITNGTTNNITCYLNGISEVTATNITVNVSSNGTFLGFSETPYGATGVNMYYSDVYIDNGSSGDTGDIWVTAKRPNANGTTNGFTTQIGSGGSGYGTGHSPQVNERPISTTNGWSVAAVAATTEEYNIEAKSAGDIDISNATIIDYMGWVSTSALTNENGSIIVNGNNSTINITTVAGILIKMAGSATYPAGTGADIGIITSATVTTVSLYECGIIVAYIPAVASTNKFLSLMGTGT